MSHRFKSGDQDKKKKKQKTETIAWYKGGIWRLDYILKLTLICT